MLKKSKNILLSILCLSLISICAVTLGACNKKDDPVSLREEYTVDYGDSFAIPLSGHKVTVKDSQGQEVEVYGGYFAAYDLNGYTIEYKGGVSKVKVIDRNAPSIDVEFEYIRVEGTESKVDFPTIEATDNVDGKTNVGLTLKNPQAEEITFEDNAFLPEEIGTYVLDVVSTDKQGNTSTKQVYFDVVEETLGLKTVVGAFDSVYGQKHLKSVKGFTPKYVTDVALHGERGSTKLEFNYDEIFAPTFRFTNLIENDVSDYQAIAMSVYNDSNISITLMINWVFSYTLKPNDWTEIYIPASKFATFENVGNEITQDRVSAKSLENLYFELYSRTGNGFYNMDLYLSEFYAIKAITPTEFEVVLDKVTDINSEEDLSQYEQVFKTYNQFTTEEKLQIKKYNQIQNKYWNYMIETYADGKVDDNKVYYLNNNLGKKQYVVGGGTAELSEEIYCPDDENGDKVVTKLTSTGGWLHFTLNNPLVQNMSSVDIDSQGNKILKNLYFNVYVPTCEEGYAYYCDMWNSAKWIEIPLKAGWNFVEYPLNNGSVDNLELELALKLNGNYVSMPADRIFYFTAIYGYQYGTKRIDKEIETLISKELTDQEFLQESEKIIATYSKLADEEKAKSSTAIEQFKAKYRETLNRLYDIPKDDRLFYLDEEYGLNGLTHSSGTDVSYTTEEAYDGANGSLMLKRNVNEASVWGFRLNLNIAFTDTDNTSFYCYIKYESSSDEIIESVANWQNWKTATTKLVKGEWTRVKLDSDWLVYGSTIFITCNNWLSEIPTDCTVYVSAIFIE